jgi:hypothetical protein
MFSISRSILLSASDQMKEEQRPDEIQGTGKWKQECQNARMPECKNARMQEILVSEYFHLK